MANYPFVNFERWLAQDIDSTPNLIFGNDQSNCIIDGVFITNTTPNVISVNIYILYEDDEEIPTQHTLGQSISIDAYGCIDLLKGSTITTKAGDTIFAYSDFSGNLFNTCVSYRVLNQTPIINP